MQMALRQSSGSTVGAGRDGQGVVAGAGPIPGLVSGADEERGEAELGGGSQGHKGEKEGMVVGPHCKSAVSHARVRLGGVEVSVTLGRGCVGYMVHGTWPMLDGRD